MLNKNTKCRNAFLYNIFQHAAENSKVNCELFGKTDFSGDRLIFSNFIKRYNMSPSLETKSLYLSDFEKVWRETRSTPILSLISLFYRI